MKKLQEQVNEMYNEFQLDIKEAEELERVGAEEDWVIDRMERIHNKMMELWVEIEYNEIEDELGRKIDDEEEYEVRTLIEWDYTRDDCLKMLYNQQTAEEYEYSRG